MRFGLDSLSSGSGPLQQVLPPPPQAPAPCWAEEPGSWGEHQVLHTQSPGGRRAMGHPWVTVWGCWRVRGCDPEPRALMRPAHRPCCPASVCFSSVAPLHLQLLTGFPHPSPGHAQPPLWGPQTSPLPVPLLHTEHLCLLPTPRFWIYFMRLVLYGVTKNYPTTGVLSSNDKSVISLGACPGSTTLSSCSLNPQ